MQSTTRSFGEIKHRYKCGRASRQCSI